MMVDEADIDLVGGGAGGTGRGQKRPIAEAGSGRPNKRKPGPIPKDLVVKRPPTPPPCPSPPPSPIPTPEPVSAPSPASAPSPPPPVLSLQRPPTPPPPLPPQQSPPSQPPLLVLVNGDISSSGNVIYL